MAENELKGQISRIEERIVHIGNDELLPLELTKAEIRFLYDTVKEVLELGDADTKDFYTKLESLKDPPAILIEELKVEPSFLGDRSFTIFNNYDIAYIELYRPANLKARKGEKFWLKRFEKEFGRLPSDEERESFLNVPGYQLQVLGTDNDSKTKMIQKLQANGFPVSPYRGLEQDDEVKDKNVDLTRIGRKHGEFNLMLEGMLTELQGEGLAKLAAVGRITIDQLSGLRADPEALRKLAYEMTISMVKINLKKENPNYSNTEIDSLMFALDMYRAMGQL